MEVDRGIEEYQSLGVDEESIFLLKYVPLKTYLC
ncbi:hypothetical protein NIES22_20880 [Calothrix brevissima NIES-22]|nr:hypothetical protein NIES22_20880 [Calothrix brevissima NIES-22]